MQNQDKLKQDSAKIQSYFFTNLIERQKIVKKDNLAMTNFCLI